MEINQIILASGSPRRKELLEQLGLDFTIKVAIGEEIPKGDTPEEMVCYLAKNKALEVAETVERPKFNTPISLVIGADTLVVLEDRILGKPKDEQEAIEILKCLSGKRHSVFTGVAFVVIEDNGCRLIDSFAQETYVDVYPMDKQEILDYVATKDPMDKAGAYGIQGIFARYIKGISGEYSNVVGLPIGRVWQSLKKINSQK